MSRLDPERRGPGILAQSTAFVLSRSGERSAVERAAVLKAAARGDLNEAMDAMLAWAISERRKPLPPRP